MVLQDSYNDFIGFEITNIVEDSGPVNEEIQFEYPNPAIGIDTGGNFIKHEIIGGATVRQKIGDKPLQVSVSGICTETTAKKLDKLRNAKQGEIYSDRFEQLSVTVQFVSISTQPMEDGGAADMSSGEFLYTFDLECVEILDTGDDTVGTEDTLIGEVTEEFENI